VLAEAVGLERGIVGDGVIVPSSWAYEAPPEDGPNAEEIERLWEAAGWERVGDGPRTRGIPLSLQLVANSDPRREALAEEIARQLAGQGVEVEVIVEPASRVISDYLRAGQYQMAL